MSGKPSLTIRRRLNAPPAQVYAAWTEPAQLARWWGPGRSEVISAALEPRPGGRFDIHFRTEDGEEHGVGGVYREVVPNERLVFSWAWRSTPERVSQVTVILKPDSGGTILLLTHEHFFDEAARTGHSRGWTGSLDRLELLFS